MECGVYRDRMNAMDVTLVKAGDIASPGFFGGHGRSKVTYPIQPVRPTYYVPTGMVPIRQNDPPLVPRSTAPLQYRFLCTNVLHSPYISIGCGQRTIRDLHDLVRNHTP